MATTYERIADDLRDAIRDGGEIGGVQLGPDVQLPTEAQLRDLYDGVSRGTVQKALGILASEGLLESQGRRGTFVRRLPMVQYHADPTTAPAYDAFAAQADDAREEFAFRIEPASKAVALELRIRDDALVVVRTVTRYRGDVPWGQQTFYIPMGIAHESELDQPYNRPGGSLRELEAAGYPETGSTTRTGARPATADEARVLELSRGVYVLEHKLTAYSGKWVVRHSVEVLPADRNEIVEHHGQIPQGA